MAISVQDDGVGMARSNLHCMLSFGFSSKEHVVGNVGGFGIGFKSGFTITNEVPCTPHERPAIAPRLSSHVH